jgi:hydrogenase/urease accessory protein HupE
MLLNSCVPNDGKGRNTFSAMMKLIFIVFAFLFCLLLASPIHAHGLSYAEQQAILQGGYLVYFWLGVQHMLTGYDHLLFLFGIIFFLTKFKDIVKLITAFTLGHSITLIFATLLKINANYYLIDAIIALTVCYKGFDNLDGFKKFLKISPPDLLNMVFVFGLIHGFGLSARLQHLPLGYSGIVFRVLAFNVGVEVGQIAALTVMVIFLYKWRKTESFFKFSVAANSGLILAGIFLFMMQMHGYIQQRFPNDIEIVKKVKTAPHDKKRVNEVVEDDVFNLRK